MKAAHVFSVAVGLGLAVACGVEVDIDNKHCNQGKCGDGYVCDPVNDICVKPGQQTVVITPPPVEPACDPCTCAVDADCKDSTRPFCAPDSKTCVECNPNDDKCRVGTYCNAKFQCTVGCHNDDACMQLSPQVPHCAMDRHQCVECLTSATCTGGKMCSPSGTCVDTCTGTTGCSGTQKCCNNFCLDVAMDVLNCGDCNKVCMSDNGSPRCKDSACQSDCADGFADCSPDVAGCETPTRGDANNCGGCNIKCTSTMFANTTGPRCAQGHCGFTACAPGFLNTDGLADNGCEEQCGKKNGPCCDNNQCDEGSCKSHRCVGN